MTRSESPPPRGSPEAATGLSQEELEALATSLGARSFHGRQIARWVYARGVTDWGPMTDLSQDLRSRLADQLPVTTGSRIRSVEVAPDSTEKVQISLADENGVEGVIIREDARITFCLSTQVGCAAGCRFCRSGLAGLLRNLSRAEIVEEVLHLRSRLRDHERITNIVFMGIGEPLDNYQGLVGALSTLRAAWGFELSPRRVTVSTVGRVQRIRQLAEEGFPVTLAISLHAGRQETRDRLVTGGGPPTTLEEIVAEGRRYSEVTGRNVTFEYVLIEGENDSVEEARALAGLVGGSNIHVNIIPVNPVDGTGFTPPPTGTIQRFREVLDSARIPVTIRKRKGDEIMAACGQLASSEFMRR